MSGSHVRKFSTVGRVTGVAAALLVTLATVAAPPGSHTAPGVAGGGESGVAVVRLPAPDAATEQAYRDAQKKRVEAERELKTIRAQYFKGIRNTEIRQVGISKLRKFDDPALYPSLLELFKNDEQDVRAAILDMLIDQRSDEADAAIAWAAVYGNDKWFREEAAKRLLDRSKEAGVSHRVQSVIAIGLRDRETGPIVAAAEMANILKLYEAIPMLINAQVAGGGGGQRRADDGGDPALAYILVGQQIAFVSDLTPVVGDSAVAFDPTLSVATDGVILRVIDAYVITYRVDVHNALVGLANKGWDGRDTASMGWDEQKWRDWYAKEFVPYRASLASEKAEARK